MSIRRAMRVVQSDDLVASRASYVDLLGFEVAIDRRLRGDDDEQVEARVRSP